MARGALPHTPGTEGRSGAHRHRLGASPALRPVYPKPPQPMPSGRRTRNAGAVSPKPSTNLLPAHLSGGPTAPPQLLPPWKDPERPPLSLAPPGPGASQSPSTGTEPPPPPRADSWSPCPVDTQAPGLLQPVPQSPSRRVFTLHPSLRGPCSLPSLPLHVSPPAPMDPATVCPGSPRWGWDLRHGRG